MAIPTARNVDRLTIRHLEDEAAMQAIAAAGALLGSCEAPVCARPPWLGAWGATHAPAWRPHVISVLDDQEPAGLAALALRRRGPLTDVVMLGHGLSDYALLAAADRRAATSLAGGMIGFLTRLPGPWRMRLDQLPAGDPTALMVAAALPCSQVVAGTTTLRFTPPADPELRTLRKLGGRKLAQSRNRTFSQITAAGLAHELRTTRDQREIQELLDVTIDLHRTRDRDMGRRSDLDDPAERAFYRQVVTTLAGRGEVELITLRVAGEIAAYALCLLDGDTYRAWDGRMDSRWTKFGAGRLCQLAAIESALANPRITTIDLMRGESPLKSSLVDETVEHEHLHAASSYAVWNAWQGATRLRESVPGPVRKALRRAGRPQ